jgi:hypothetical protein
MFEKLKKLFVKSEAPAAAVAPEPTPPKPKKSRKPRVKPEPKTENTVLGPKEQATLRGEPYVTIVSMDIDADDPHNGAFTLDYNDKFVANLIRAGYKQRADDTDDRIVDRWFQIVCRNIALEIYEQEQADPRNREDQDNRGLRRRNIGDGRAEIS